MLVFLPYNNIYKYKLNISNGTLGRRLLAAGVEPCGKRKNFSRLIAF